MLSGLNFSLLSMSLTHTIPKVENPQRLFPSYIENQSKHGIPFADTFGVFEDPNAVMLEDFRSGEQR
jgi:hypothetical protein